jgi:hypothetical protein
MIRHALIVAAAPVLLALYAASAQAAPIGTAAGLNLAGTSPLMAAGGHSVCLKAQCPGRSRIVCGCSRSTR